MTPEETYEYGAVREQMTALYLSQVARKKSHRARLRFALALFLLLPGCAKPLTSRLWCSPDYRAAVQNDLFADANGIFVKTDGATGASIYELSVDDIEAAKKRHNELVIWSTTIAEPCVKEAYDYWLPMVWQNILDAEQETITHAERKRREVNIQRYDDDNRRIEALPRAKPGE